MPSGKKLYLVNNFEGCDCCVNENKNDGGAWNDHPQGHLVAGLAPRRELSCWNPLNLAEEPGHLDKKDDKGDEEAEQEPDVDHLEVGGHGQSRVDALVQRVHDQHDGEGQADGHLGLVVIKEERQLRDDQQADGRQVGVGQVVREDPLEVEVDQHHGVVVVRHEGALLDGELGQRQRVVDGQLLGLESNALLQVQVKLKLEQNWKNISNNLRTQSGFEIRLPFSTHRTDEPSSKLEAEWCFKGFKGKMFIQ